MSRRSLMAIPALVCALSLISFELICVIENIRSGPTHADDAYFASIAKNVAIGMGYGTTIQPYSDVYKFVPFDPQVSIGPIPVFLVAALIAVFGNVSWVPGVGNILLQSSMLGLAIVTLYRSRPTAAAVFSFLFLLAIVSTGRWHFALWYSMLGEGTVVAATTLVACLIVCRDGPGARRFTPSMLFGAGLLCGVAVSTKLLALLPIAPVLVLLGPLSQPTARARFVATLRLHAGFFTPLAAFEAFRFFSLGPTGYLTSTRQWIAFVFRQSKNVTDYGGFFEQLDFRSADLYRHFGLPTWLLIGITLAGVLLLMRSGRAVTAKILGSSAVVCWVWWFAISPGWPRYAYSGITLAILSIGLAAFANGSARPSRAERVRAVVAVTGLLIAIVAGSLKIGFLPADILARGFDLEHRARLANTIEAVRTLRESRADRPYFTQLWATAAATEYLLPGSGYFTPIVDPRFQRAANALIVLDRPFIIEDDAVLEDLLAHRCSKKFFDSPTLSIASCDRNERTLAAPSS